MFGRLLPHEPVFFDFFEQHIQLIVQAAQYLHQFMLSEPSASLSHHFIKDLEHQADEIVHRCIENLHKTFITPLQQDDIFRLISRMDDIIDSIDAAFDDCLIYRISSFTPAAQNLTRILVQASEKIEVNIKSLRDRQKLAVLIREMNKQIHLLESEADEVLRQALGQLFDEEKDIRLLIKWKEIYEVLEQGVDYCEDVANIIEGIILEYD